MYALVTYLWALYHKMEKLRFHLTTYPRSGSHYFEKVMHKQTKRYIEKSHAVTWLLDKNNNKQRTIITIARDPIESIASYIAVEHRGEYPVTMNRVNQIVSEYITKYNFMYDYADYVVDFNDLVKYPDGIVKKILSLSDINEEDYHLVGRDVPDEDNFYLATSKELPEYGKDLLEDYNIGLCYFYYNRLLEKKIIL